MIFVGLNFSELSNGLASRTSGDPFYCGAGFGSQADSNAMVFAFVVFAIPSVTRLVRFNKPMSFFEFGLHLFCLCFVIVAFFLATMDCGDIFYTAFILPDLYFASALVSLLFSTVIATKLFRMRGSLQGSL
jgi:hypothetical protein